MGIDTCRPITFPRLDDHRGSLVFAEAEGHVPFPLRRIYYLFAVPPGVERGGHGHRKLEQVFVAIHGSFELVVDDARVRTSFLLDRPDRGLYVGPMMWREVRAFSAGAVCLVLASQHFDEGDYIRDYAEFVRAVRGE